MKTLPAFFLLFFINNCLAQNEKEPVIETGVSKALAQYRSANLSDLHYRLHFTLPANRNMGIPARETIEFSLLKNDFPLQLDFKENADHLKAINVNGQTTPIRLETEHLLIDTKFLKRGFNKIDIEFFAGELSLNRNDDYLYTLLVPDRARTLFPCFDQPNLKARFTLTLTLPNNWQALANAPVQRTSKKNEVKTIQFSTSDLFSTYLFSFVAGTFNSVSKTSGKQKITFIHRETDKEKIHMSVDTVFKWHQHALEFMEKYSALSFPFQKLDFAAIPDFQYGGMEHVGAIDYKASTLFLDSSATKDQENARSNVIAHETAHMWFGDLVTMRWFNDVWMKEVFANFLADKITRTQGVDTDYNLKFLLTHFPRAYSIDRTAGANPIRQSLENLQEAGNLYGSIIYNKAPIMMRQLERLMGETAFRDGLRLYLKKYKFNNAGWPELISIFDKLTPADLQAWNQTWVNTPDRPVLDYTLEEEHGKITSLHIRQNGGRSNDFMLPQYFELALVYPDQVEKITINMNAPVLEVKAAKGKPAPLFILFNSSGEGYGVFPIDPKMKSHVSDLSDPVMRASAYITLYENMLNGNALHPRELLPLYLMWMQQEDEELSLGYMATQLRHIFWQLLSASVRQQTVSTLEKELWAQTAKQSTANKKKILFNTYAHIALTPAALDTLFHIWQKQSPPPGINLSEEDYTTLALQLTVKEFPVHHLIDSQLQRISNPDRKKRLEFMKAALSPDVKVRDAFFESLKDVSVRKKEAWVQEALAWLHHPLRTSTSIRYLPASLEMLREIQATGDIFFPAAWLSASLGNYQTEEAAHIVRDFLDQHPDYNQQLKLKILQAADPLFRSINLSK